MALPVILNAESFAPHYGDGRQEIVTKYYPTGSIFIGDNSVLQLGRGSGTYQRWCVIGNPIAAYGWPTLSGPTKIGQGLAFNRRNNPFQSAAICEFWDSDNLSTGHLNLAVLCNAAGQIEYWQNTGMSSVRIAGPSSYVLPLNGYTWVETLLDFGGGTVTTKVANGVTALTDGSFTAGIGASAVTKCVVAGSMAFNSENFAYSDWVVHDGTGTGYINDCAVGYFPAQALGTLTAGSPIGAAALVDCVSEVTGTHEQNYIDYTTSGLPKGTSFTPLALPSNTQAVLAVSPRIVVRRTDAVTDTGRLYFKSGATVDDGGVDVTLQTDWYIWDRIYNTDPNTSAAWTIANANACETGFERTA